MSKRADYFEQLCVECTRYLRNSRRMMFLLVQSISPLTKVYFEQHPLEQQDEMFHSITTGLGLKLQALFLSIKFVNMVLANRGSPDVMYNKIKAAWPAEHCTHIFELLHLLGPPTTLLHDHRAYPRISNVVMGFFHITDYVGKLPASNVDVKASQWSSFVSEMAGLNKDYDLQLQRLEELIPYFMAEGETDFSSDKILLTLQSLIREPNGSR